jgi:V/A-type H+-transporting ATPase subunit I
MAKVRVIGLRSALEKVILYLHNYGGVQFKEFSGNDVEKDVPRGQYGEMAEHYVKLEALERFLTKQQVEGRKETLSLQKLLMKCRDTTVYEKAERLQEELAGIDTQRQHLSDLKKKAGLFRGSGIDFSRPLPSSVELIAGRIARTKADAVKDALSSLTDKFTVFGKACSKQDKFLVILVEKAVSEKAKNAVEKTGFVREDITEFSTGAWQKEAEIAKKLKALDAQERGLKEEKERMSEKHYAEVVRLKEMLYIEKQRAELTAKFGRTKDFFLFEAYLPEKNLTGFTAKLKARFGDSVRTEGFGHMELDEMHEVAPTILENPKKLGVFQFMIEFISLPRSNELDPTVLFAFLFPVFYGLMLGDVAYGLISLLAALALLKISSPQGLLNHISRLWAVCSLPTIFFGVLFDEYLGFSHHKILSMLGFHDIHLYAGMERMHNLETLLLLTIFVGLAAMTLAFLLGFVNEVRKKNTAHAAAKAGWVGLIISGAVLVAGLMFSAVPGTLITPAALLFVVSLIPIIRAEGIIGIMEIPSVVGNILSFSRILAVGLASVVVAMIVNQLLMPSPEQGLLAILMVPLFIIGHLFNTLLGMFESLVQGGRLNYVEFFSKFFKGGGEKFAPFMLERKFTR